MIIAAVCIRPDKTVRSREPSTSAAVDDPFMRLQADVRVDSLLHLAVACRAASDLA